MRYHHVPLVSAAQFNSLGTKLIRDCKGAVRSRRFRALFGISAVCIAILWADIANQGFLNHLGLRSLKPMHFLWTLLFLKVYSKEEVNAMQVGCDEKTFRKWTWFYAECIADLDTQYVSK